MTLELRAVCAMFFAQTGCQSLNKIIGIVKISNTEIAFAIQPGVGREDFTVIGFKWM